MTRLWWSAISLTRERRLVSKKGAVALEPAPQRRHVEGRGRRAGLKRERRGGAGGLAHGEAGAAGARRRLALMGHRGAAPGDEEIGHARRHQHAVGQGAPAAAAVREEAPSDAALKVQLHRPGVDADGVVEIGAAEDVFAGEEVAALDPPRLADADLGRDLDDVRVLEARHLAREEAEILPHLPAALDLARAQLQRIGAVHGAAVAVTDLRDVDAPLGLVLLRAHHGAGAREAVGAAARRLVHEAVDGLEL